MYRNVEAEITACRLTSVAVVRVESNAIIVHDPSAEIVSVSTLEIVRVVVILHRQEPVENGVTLGIEGRKTSKWRGVGVGHVVGGILSSRVNVILVPARGTLSIIVAQIPREVDVVVLPTNGVFVVAGFRSTGDSWLARGTIGVEGDLAVLGDVKEHERSVAAIVVGTDVMPLVTRKALCRLPNGRISKVVHVPMRCSIFADIAFFSTRVE